MATLQILDLAEKVKIGASLNNPIDDVVHHARLQRAALTNVEAQWHLSRGSDTSGWWCAQGRSVTRAQRSCRSSWLPSPASPGPCELCQSCVSEYGI